MGLVKSNKSAALPPTPKPGSSITELHARLDDPDPATRRFAARALASVAAAGEMLCDRLEVEQDESVRLALLGSLREHCTPVVVDRLVETLRSEDAGLRSSVIELLSEWPEAVALRILALLSDPDSDVRIFAVNILSLLAHPDVPVWLKQVLEEDPHVNVCAAAVDILTDVGSEDAVPALEALIRRFPVEPFLTFAVGLELQRIGPP